ncbi:ATP-binding protein [Arthrobacter sp. LAPM80]|uniref:ATP-binding protein n=1 Tax=Arthrobacter sp. LAPM80 TaxID=3141788 RepID=UPI00398B7D8A
MALRPNSVELTELVLARCIGAFALVLIALALPDLLKGDGPTMGPDYAVFVFLIPALTVAAIIPRRRGDLRRIFAGGAASMIMGGFLLWHLAVIGNGMSPDARPWQWGIAGAGVGLMSVARNNKLAGIYGFAFAFLVLLIPMMPAGASREWADSWQDALLTIAMTSVIVAPVWALRGAVLEQDRIAVEAVEKFADAACSEAVSRERRRLDSLTHDIILSTLIVASQSRSHEVESAAARGAVAALAQLDVVKHDAETSDGGSLTVAEWLSRLRTVVGSGGGGVPVHLAGAPQPVPVQIPLLVARALTQAAAEAVRNAAKHAPVANVQVNVSFPWHKPDALCTANVVVEICDDGPGFDVTAMPLKRMGVRGSIMERMQDVQGTAGIFSSPGSGTLVRLQWQRGRGSHGPGH